MDIKKLLKSVHATQSKKKIIVFKDKKNPQTLRFNNSKEFDVIEVVVDSGLIASDSSASVIFFFMCQILITASVESIILN